MSLDFSAEEIARRLAQSQEPPLEEGYPSAFLSDAPYPAAVLVPLFRFENNWHILLTRRSERLAEHRGQVAFPGGRSDPEDSTPEETALREAKEEIALCPQDVRILGQLNNFLTITNYSVTPVVGVIPWPYNFLLQHEEVSRIFSIPLPWLADPSNREVRQRAIPSHYAQIIHSNSPPVIYFQPYDGEMLWGISAEITVTLLKVLGLAS
ncbi:MAG: CoA pyrophosphatase [Anaerolineales bacterium]|nr:CoA pyrophosphatase [Anaerolineales bacterium]